MTGSEPDYLVLATGSWYPFPAKTEEPDIASARVGLSGAHDALLAADRAVIVAAGPAGLELGDLGEGSSRATRHSHR